MDFVYKVLVGVDIFGRSSNYSMRIWKYKIKSETNLNYIVWGEREGVKKKEIGQIQEGNLQNSSRNIRYMVWLINQEDIKNYKEQMILKIKETINTYRNQLQQLEDMMDTKIKIMMDDRSNIDDIPKYEITEDMF